jgi:quinone-modifying oxidoreductase subunit QmoC
MIRHSFVYPFSFWSPLRILANLGGIALIAGCGLMIRDRLRKNDEIGPSAFADWFLVGTLFCVAATGFAAEGMHYLRIEPARYFVYFAHLVCVFMLLIYLPYSKLAHLVYRTTAMVYAEYTGRTGGAAAEEASEEQAEEENEQEGEEEAKEGEEDQAEGKE